MDFFKELFSSSSSSLKQSKWFSMYYLFDWILSLVGVVVIELVFGAYFGGVSIIKMNIINNNIYHFQLICLLLYIYYYNFQFMKNLMIFYF